MQNKPFIKPGTLLVAHPDLTDHFFRKSVVLITEANIGGYVGLCLNRSSGLDMPSVLEKHGVSWPLGDELYVGGPIQEQALFMLHTTEFASSNTLAFANYAAVSSDELMIEKMQMGDVPVNYKFISGMAGWNPSQLEKEIIKEKSWLTCEANEDIVYCNSSRHWEKAIDLCAASMIDQYI